jgi:hypothetical protein
VRVPAALVVVVVVVVVAAVARGVPASPLREQIAELACGDAAARQRALTALEQAPRGALGLPDASLGRPAADVEAYVIDRLLEVLGEVRRRDPASAARVDALVASWDYCAVTADEHAWDLRVEGATVQRTQQSYPSTTAGRGFLAWGLIPRRANGRPLPEGPAGVVPAPGDPEATCDVALPSRMPSGPLAAPPVVTGADPGCEPPRGPAAAPAVAPDVAPDVEIEPAGPRTEPPAATVRAPGRPRVMPPPRRELGQVETGSGIAALHALGLSGSGFVRQAFTGKLDAGVQASWSPRANTFARIGATWQLAGAFSPDAHARPTWSLGLGYDDWHTGTLSFQINQWGPVVPGDGWTIARTAAAELAYKVPLGRTLGEHLALKLAVSSKLTWSPAAAAALSFKLPRAVFVSVGGASSLVAPGRPTWTYTVGRSTWSPGSLSVIVTNFGPNLVPHPNVVAHGAVTASWGWAW